MPIEVVEIHHHGIRIDGDEAGLAANLDSIRAFLGSPLTAAGRHSRAYRGFG